MPRPLFIIAADSLHYLLRNDTLVTKVLRPLLPNNDELSNIQFADDMAIIFQLKEENMYYLMGKLDIFSAASGSKVSLAKSALPKSLAHSSTMMSFPTYSLLMA